MNSILVIDSHFQVIIKRRYGLITLVLSLALPSLTLLVSAFLFFIICKTTGHSQIKQLRIKSTRSYIKKGVKLPNGQRTTSNDAQIQHQQALESQHSSVPSSLIVFITRLSTFSLR